ncbi:citrate synthase [Corynespora cassiicola Philippines]|uniref:Citrate synthase n=1 Tax=Corynespora cassiicola Philippines TaxID=1448308 RepID=A0A2T2NYU5_CORCC|nr:citrate synthase [Corynespora cassiicola Philippines]
MANNPPHHLSIHYLRYLRTFRFYTIPIENNSIQATSLMQISPLPITASKHDHINKGLVVLDPGFRNTAVGESHLTYIDGNKGTLQYRQYSIGYLYKNHDYEDVAHLLIFGHLPTSDMKASFRARITANMIPDESVINTVQSLSPTAPTHLMITAGLSAWAAASPSAIPVHSGQSLYQDLDNIDAGIFRSLGAIATTVAIAYCHQNALPFSTASISPSLSQIENMLKMMHRVDSSGAPEEKARDAINRIWILFADHEMTNSTATFLSAASTLCDPLSAIITSVASGSGPLHAGAIDMVYKRFGQMGNKEGVAKHMDDVRAKKTRLMGVGHRVYRTVDPRVEYIREVMASVQIGVEKIPLLDVAMEVDRIVATDEYFVKRGLCINADLYGSFVYAALEFDARIFVQLAGTARSAGILAHWRESSSQGPCLWRPKQIFNGLVVS